MTTPYRLSGDESKSYEIEKNIYDLVFKLPHRNEVDKIRIISYSGFQEWRGKSEQRRPDIWADYNPGKFMRISLKRKISKKLLLEYYFSSEIIQANDCTAKARIVYEDGEITF